MLRVDQTFSNLLVMGKSGAGKQPRIEVLTREFGMTQLSTGDLFRSYLKKFDSIDYEGDIRLFYDATSDTFWPDDKILHELGPVAEWEDPAGVLLGLKAKYFVESGKFAPDSITNAMFEAEFVRRDCRGMVLDGFPRTLAQAELLLDLVIHYDTNIDLILLVDNEDQLIIERTVGRRVCPDCNQVYHLDHKPPVGGKRCHRCGVDVIHRVDDREDTIRNRLDEYHAKAEPALRYLKSKGIPVATVCGNLLEFTDEAVRESVLLALKATLR